MTNQVINKNLPTFNVPGAPDLELSRSRAATRVGQMAAASGLRLSHFEYRHHLPLPEDWIPHDRPDLAGDPTWQGGRLIEHKYQHFRYENPVGSFHPGHRAKWTAHELCHGLVGFAWWPGASPLVNALAARLAEVLPVALWYFFDEAGLRRCAKHAGGGPLYGTWCADCDRAAELGPIEDAQAERWHREGRAFVDRELAAIAHSRRTGRSISHQFTTLNLASDALAYTAANRLRMASPEFARYIELFHGPELGCYSDLDALEARVLEVQAAICGDGPLAPLSAGADRVVAQDLGWRLLQISADCEGEIVDALDGLATRLAEKPEAIAPIITDYQSLTEDWFLPPAAEVFAVGYSLVHLLVSDGALDDYGLITAPAMVGIESLCPDTVLLLGDDFPELATRFVQTETPTRGVIARRFATFLAAERALVGDVARYEVAIADPGPPDAEVEAFGTDLRPTEHVRVAEGVELLKLSVDARGICAALITDSPIEIEAQQTWLAVRRSVSEVVIAELSADAAAYVLDLQTDGPQARDKMALTLREFENLWLLGILTGPYQC